MSQSENIFGLILGAVGSLTGLAGLNYALSTKSKVDRACDKLNVSLDQLANGERIDIPQKVLEAAANRAAESAADRYVKSEMKTKVEELVARSVHSKSDELNDMIADDFHRKLSDYTETRLRDDIADRVAKKASYAVDRAVTEAKDQWVKTLDRRLANVEDDNYLLYKLLMNRK